MENPSFENEEVQTNDDGIMKEIGEILKSQKNSIIRVRHFSFINFDRYNVKWNPHWFSMVRDPIDRVSDK